MTKHTPGPWTAISDAAHPANGRITSEARPHVAKVYALGMEPDEVAMANAALIAAAPDLLAELDCRVGDLFLLKKAIEAGDPKAELLFRIEDMLKETKAAIAKATAA